MNGLAGGNAGHVAGAERRAAGSLPRTPGGSQLCRTRVPAAPRTPTGPGGSTSVSLLRQLFLEEGHPAGPGAHCRGRPRGRFWEEERLLSPLTPPCVPGEDENPLPSVCI